jgi:glycosyltransferase involved in cell wall biosynthesis
VSDTPSSRTKLSPILGLPIDDEVATPSLVSTLEPATMRLSVIVPARNEERNLPVCLTSLVSQSDEFFLLGRDWEVIVVDDGSTDRTPEVAAGFEGVRVLTAPALENQEFTGKNSACWFGAGTANGEWLLFTDADTAHDGGNLLRALHEAERYGASLLSYSPRQIVRGLWQRALMPLIFSELAVVYPTAEVNDPGRRLAAANGQFLMVERAAYFAVGGHREVGREVLEDVELASNVKDSKRVIRFRYAADALSTRMYRGFGDMVEGWTKNLALLFPHALALAAWRLLDVGLLLLPMLLIRYGYLPTWEKAVIWVLWLRTLIRFYGRVWKSKFSPFDCVLSPLALPLFVGLLVRSWISHRILHQVAWKGREIRTKVQ